MDMIYRKSSIDRRSLRHLVDFLDSNNNNNNNGHNNGEDDDDDSHRHHQEAVLVRTQQELSPAFNW
jgi:hypothetical protein